MTSLRVALSGTPIEKELRALDEGLARVAPSTERFDAALYDPRAVTTVAAQWERRMVFEHRSSTVFTQLAAQLFEANAALDLQIVMLRMAQDELRHTRTCARVVEALGGRTEVPIDAVLQPLARHPGCSPEERALRNVLFTTCCSELVACARFVATLDRTRDAFVRDALRALLADEVLHGQFGFHYLAACAGWLDAEPGARASIERYLTHAFVHLERELAPRGPFAPLSEDERALGGDDPAEAREVFYGTIEGALIPGLEQLGLAAGKAWRERRELA